MPTLTASPEPWLAVAHLVRPQGRKGELLAELWTEFPDRFAGEPRVFLAPPGFNGAPEQARSATVTSFWLPTGKQKGRIVLGLDISHSITDAEALAGNDVLVPRTERRPLQQGAVYVHDLVGCTILDVSADRAEVVGTVQDVLSIGGGAFDTEAPEGAPVLVVTGADAIEYLIPFAQAYLRRVDLEHQTIEMALPASLLDLYRSGDTGQKR